MQYLYRAYDESGQLLYVGISGKWSERLHQHERTSDWMTQTDYVKIERFETRAEVSRAEKRAVEQERPKYNRQYSQDYESPGNHFQQIKLWFKTGTTDAKHSALLFSMTDDFNHLGWEFKKNRSRDIAWLMLSNYDYLAAHDYVICRNCDAISRHGQFQYWMELVEEEMKRGEFYDA